MRPALVLFTLFGVTSFIGSRCGTQRCCAPLPAVSAACNGSDPCKVRTNCKRCKYCKAGGTCGACKKVSSD